MGSGSEWKRRPPPETGAAMHRPDIAAATDANGNLVPVERLCDNSLNLDDRNVNKKSIINRVASG